MTPSINIRHPSDCTEEELSDFTSLVTKSNEVLADGLEERINNAFLIGFAMVDDIMVSVAAIKCPTENYSKRIFAASRCGLSATDYPFEYGWAYTEPEHRRQGIATTLIKALLLTNTSSMWATTKESNRSVHTILSNHGFTTTGVPFRGNVENIVLWIRRAF